MVLRVGVFVRVKLPRITGFCGGPCHPQGRSVAEEARSAMTQAVSGGYPRVMASPRLSARIEAPASFADCLQLAPCGML